MAATLIWNDLELLERLGEGQAGEVWAARLRRSFRDLAAGQLVAVKRYKRWVLDEPGQYERILREVATGARIDHPNVLRTLCLVSDEHGFPCLVMQHYSGWTLAKELNESRNQGRIPLPDRAFPLLRDVAAAVAALHGVGVLHRDIKPANVMIDSARSCAVLMDLGVVTDTLLPEHTRTEAFLGTIRYAHPLYLAGQDFSPRFDVYSVGAIGFELLLGTQFISAEQQWARLVARVIANPSPTSSELALACQRLSDIHGHDVAEAAYWVLRTLFRGRNEVLSQIVGAVKARLWEGPFFETSDGSPVPGQPPNLDKMIDKLREYDATKTLLLLRRNYWTLRVQSDFGELAAERIPPLLSAARASRYSSWWDRRPLATFRDLLALFRYRMLSGGVKQAST